MISKREALGWVAAFTLGVALMVADTNPNPYRDVSVVRSETIDDQIEFVATFEKTDCEFDNLVVVSSLLGETKFLNWSDLDGLASDVDRTLGKQTLRLAIDLPDSGYDWIEIRTRHDCDGSKVDKVFARLD